MANKLKLFVCGPTTYDLIHIGNARTFVVFDSYAKWLRHTGVDLEYIMNITDIDDKIIARAKEQNREPAEFAKEWEEKFYEDAKALDITAPVYKRAMDHVPEIKSQVDRLLKSGHAYELEDLPGRQAGGIYFDLSTFADYGKLSGRTNLQDDDAISRVDENPNKKNKGDFCIWKKDRPGWHIEDTAITEKYFGPQYDIHGGGMDLMFPHHEAEIAIMESISGLSPFVKKWMHVGFLVNKQKKMSKSACNFMTAREALKIYSPEALRFYFLSAHYRSPLDFTEDIIKQAEAATARLAEFIKKLTDFEDEMQLSQNELFDATVRNAEKDFAAALNDDFNTPKAFAVLFDLMKALNVHITSRVLDRYSAQRAVKFLKSVNDVLGIIPEQHLQIPKTVEFMIESRERARQSKDYALADKLRGQIEESGYRVDDTAYGPLIKHTNPL